MLRGRFPGSRSIGTAMAQAAIGVAAPARAGGFTGDGSFQLDPLAVIRHGFEAVDGAPTATPHEHAHEGGHLVKQDGFLQARVELTSPRGSHDAPLTPAKRALEAWRGRK